MDAAVVRQLISLKKAISDLFLEDLPLCIKARICAGHCLFLSPLLGKVPGLLQPLECELGPVEEGLLGSRPPHPIHTLIA